MWIRVSSGNGLAIGTLLLAALAACAPGRAAVDRAAPTAAERAHPSGSIGSVTAEDVRGQPVRSVEEMIASRVAGVQVVRLPNGGLSLRIRGVSSLMGSNEPLVVIDGMPVGERTLGASMIGLNPHDIARVEVLKDAASLAMYGMRGANGVILIHTKRTP